VNKAFGADKVVCLVCGKGFTTLKKHIAVSHQMTPKEYRKAFGIPTKTPLVARNIPKRRGRSPRRRGLRRNCRRPEEEGGEEILRVRQP